MDTTLAAPAPAAAPALAEMLGRLRAKHGVVGAQLAVDRAGVVTDAASGILNVELGSPATTDALFQIGSITKVYTATLVMQLVDEGRVELDAPVTRYLEVPSADPTRMAKVTVRQLLAHTSGIEGDVFADAGLGDDVLERYVAGLGTIGFVHDPGVTTSYSNTGYVIAGRLVEVVTGQVWDDALRTRLLDPLELTHTQTRAERMPRFAVAHGHAPAADGAYELVPNWMIPRSNGPAGIIAARARDVAAFERMHLVGGRGANGARVLSRAAVAQMRREHSPVPDLARRGLGWMFPEWTTASIGHDGSTYGQLAFSRVLPERDLVVVLLTNGGDGMALFDDLARELLADEVTLPAPLAPPDPLPAVDLAPFEGTYRRLGTTFRLRADGDVIAGEIVQDGDQSNTGSAQTLSLTFVPTGPDSLMTQVLGASWFAGRIIHVGGDTFLHFAGRANRRIGGPDAEVAP